MAEQSAFEKWWTWDSGLGQEVHDSEKKEHLGTWNAALKEAAKRLQDDRAYEVWAQYTDDTQGPIIAARIVESLMEEG